MEMNYNQATIAQMIQYFSLNTKSMSTKGLEELDILEWKAVNHLNAHNKIDPELCGKLHQVLIQKGACAGKSFGILGKAIDLLVWGETQLDTDDLADVLGGEEKEEELVTGFFYRLAYLRVCIELMPDCDSKVKAYYDGLCSKVLSSHDIFKGAFYTTWDFLKDPNGDWGNSKVPDDKKTESKAGSGVVLEEAPRVDRETYEETLHFFWGASVVEIFRKWNDNETGYDEREAMTNTAEEYTDRMRKYALRDPHGFRNSLKSEDFPLLEKLLVFYNAHVVVCDPMHRFLQSNHCLQDGKPTGEWMHGLGDNIHRFKEELGLQKKAGEEEEDISPGRTKRALVGLLLCLTVALGYAIFRPEWATAMLLENDGVLYPVMLAAIIGFVGGGFFFGILSGFVGYAGILLSLLLGSSLGVDEATVWVMLVCGAVGLPGVLLARRFYKAYRAVGFSGNQHLSRSERTRLKGEIQSCMDCAMRIIEMLQKNYEHATKTQKGIVGPEVIKEVQYYYSTIYNELLRLYHLAEKG